MKVRNKIILLICIIVILIAGYLYYSNFVYGSHITTDSLFVENVEVNGSIVTVEGDTACSGMGYAGYDTVWVADQLWIKPRYSIVSKANPSGRMEIAYDTKDRLFHKIFLVGAEEDDKKQIWPVTEKARTIPELEVKPITILGYSEQAAENQGYRVIMTEFFSFEVPDGWSATAEKDGDAFLVNLSNDAAEVTGSIELLPKGAETIPMESYLFEQKIHEIEGNGQETIVTVFLTDKVDQNQANITADMIADSIKPLVN